MKQKIIFICILLVTAHSLTESYGLINLWPSLKAINYDLFLSPTYKKQMSLFYYFKFPCDDLLMTILCFVVGYIGKEFSMKVYYLGLLYCFYHIIDMLFFWWDFKTNHLLYWVMLAFLIMGSIVIAWPIKEAKGKYRSLV